MKKIGIVIKREYLRRVNRKSFIILTIFAPVLFAAIVFVPLWLSTIKSSDIYEVAVYDRTGKYADLFTDTESYRFFITDRPDNTNGERHGSFALLEITDDLLEHPGAVSLYSEKQIPKDLEREVKQVLSQYLEQEKRASFNIPNLDEIMEKSHVTLDIKTIKWGKDGSAKETSSEIAAIIGMLFTVMIYMFIMIYGAMVMQGVMEEKTNRIVEVMVSSVRPFDLLMGKIIGIGLVGLTQMTVWCVLTAGLVGIGGMIFGVNTPPPDMSVMQGVNPAALTGVDSEVTDMMIKLGSFNFIEILVYFVLFFIGGYLTYASLFAAIGSAVDNPEDSQQFMTPVMVFLIFALYAGIYSIQNPDGPLAFWCSLLPVVSPIVMMVRVPYDIPFWQILVSLVVLYTSAIFFVWLSAKIYRVGILMYGKKPSLKEIARWVKY